MWFVYSAIQNNFEDYLGGKYIIEGSRLDTFEGLDFMNVYEDVYVLKGNGLEYILQKDFELYTSSIFTEIFEKFHNQFRILETLEKGNTLYSKSVCTISETLAES